MDKRKKAGIILSVILGMGGLLYLGGILEQLIANYQDWLGGNGISGEEIMKPPDWNLLVCIRHAFTINGLKGMVAAILLGAAVVLYVKFHDKFDGNEYDPRGFKKSKTGTYGTATWMSEKELKEIMEVTSPAKAEGVILGEYEGKTVCMPKDTRLTRHIAIFGASGTMKSRAIIRNALFQALKRGESVVITDSKAELYNDTSQMYRNAGYEVKVFNLVNPEHGDSWNCMSDLHGNTLMAQMLTNIIIGNTCNGKGDHFWDNGEGNLLKALILLVDLDPSRSPDTKHLPAVYQMLTRNTERQLTALFEKLPLDHPARAPFNLFAQSRDTVRSGIIQGLGTRLQVLQNREVQGITSRSDIDIPVNLVLDEFNNIGRIGGAADGSDFARSLSVIRSRDIRVMMAVQSLGQLQNRYGNNLWAEIIGNCDIQLMLGCTDDVTAEYFSGRNGEMCIEVSFTMTTRQTIALAQVIPQYRQTQGQGRRKLLTPDEVLRLPNTELLCIIRGCNILKLSKLDYTKHPMAQEMTSVSIMDYQPQVSPAACSQTGFGGEEVKEVPQAERRENKNQEPKKKGLYRLAQPPADF